MICDGCGEEAAALKTAVRRDDPEREGTLCDSCFADVAGGVFIIPGPYAVWGFCNECRGWHSLNDMHRWSGGGPHDAPQGSCLGCAEGRVGRGWPSCYRYEDPL